MRLIFYEDGNFADFYPLTLSRPASSLFLGTSMIYRKWLDALDVSEYSFFTREYLSEITALDAGADVGIVPDNELLLINGRYVPENDLVGAINSLAAGDALVCADGPIAFKLGAARSPALSAAIDRLKYEQSGENLLSLCREKRIESRPLRYLWDLISLNGEAIEREFRLFRKNAGSKSRIPPKVELVESKRIHIAAGAVLAPAVVIDASHGAVVIDENVVIEAFTYVQGPAYIGPGSRLVGGRIREGCSIGPVCRVGGEVEECIMQGYANKYHEGFLGHAYLGEWVNLGALTTNSDLKNNYTEIKSQPFDRPISTGSIKVGCFIGDHTKTGIGTMLNTGISIGFSCNLYGAALFTDRRIKSFSWGTPGSLIGYRMEKAVETASASMARRDREFTEIHHRLFARVAEIDNFS